jgi:hypothetical protein
MKSFFDKFLEAVKHLTPKQITMIIMCVMLTVTVIMATVVVVKVSPVLGALLGTPAETVPTEPTVETTVPPTTEPVTTTTPEATNPAHVHKYDTLSKEVKPTCTSTGYKIYACKCGSTEMRDTTNALGHSYGPSKLVSPTCTEGGYTYRKCNACDYEEKKDETDPLEHDLQLEKKVEATCTEGGHSLYKCSRANCDYEEKQDETDALGHKWDKGTVVKPTCEEAGYTECKCTNTGCKETKQEDPKAALGHKYGEWKVTTDPKKGDPGEQSRGCTNSGCTEKETRPCPLSSNTTMVEASDRNKYTVSVVAKDKKNKTVVVYSYTVTDYGKFKDMGFEYDEESGLIITFVDKNKNTQTYAWTDGETLFISADGEVTERDPGVTGNPTETTQPTDPTDASQPQGGTNE